MRRLPYLFAFPFAAFACTSCVVFAGENPEMTYRAIPLSASAATMTPGPDEKMLGYEVSYRGMSLPTPISASLAQRNTKVARSELATIQLDDKSGLRYHYAGRSSLSFSARPHHLRFAWRTRF